MPELEVRSFTINLNGTLRPKVAVILCALENLKHGTAGVFF